MALKVRLGLADNHNSYRLDYEHAMHVVVVGKITAGHRDDHNHEFNLVFLVSA